MSLFVLELGGGGLTFGGGERLFGSMNIEHNAHSFEPPPHHASCRTQSIPTVACSVHWRRGQRCTTAPHTLMHRGHRVQCGGDPLVCFCYYSTPMNHEYTETAAPIPIYARRPPTRPQWTHGEGFVDSKKQYFGAQSLPTFCICHCNNLTHRRVRCLRPFPSIPPARPVLLLRCTPVLSSVQRQSQPICNAQTIPARILMNCVKFHGKMARNWRKREETGARGEGLAHIGHRHEPLVISCAPLLLLLPK